MGKGSYLNMTPVLIISQNTVIATTPGKRCSSECHCCFIAAFAVIRPGAFNSCCILLMTLVPFHPLSRTPRTRFKTGQPGIMDAAVLGDVDTSSMDSQRIRIAIKFAEVPNLSQIKTHEHCVAFYIAQFQQSPVLARVVEWPSGLGRWTNS